MIALFAIALLLAALFVGMLFDWLRYQKRLAQMAHYHATKVNSPAAEYSLMVCMEAFFEQFDLYTEAELLALIS